MKKNLLIPIAAATIIAASAARATIIVVPDATGTPSGTTVTTDISTPNGGVVLPATNGTTVFYTSTFNFGSDTSATLGGNFIYTNGTANRLGISITSAGSLSTLGYGGSGGTESLGSVTGKSVVVLAELIYDKSVYNPSGNNNTQMSVWVNPTSSSSATSPDFSVLWNSNTFGYWKNAIGTSTGSTSSSITNTQIFTGSDATYTNAYNASVVPEPSSMALLGLGLGGLFLRRRRRD